eukprot:scaffold20636_cov73-Phaeocystis_antarctica.AAC.7
MGPQDMGLRVAQLASVCRRSALAPRYGKKRPVDGRRAPRRKYALAGAKDTTRDGVAIGYRLPTF